MRRNPHPAVGRTAVVWGWSVALAFALASTAGAQEDVLNELYGSGVHAFNSGDYRQAYNDLVMAVRSGSKDPRVFYYRGLTYLRLGRPQEAQADFKKGAALEMADSDRFYPVSKSLERIQGQARQQIERYRSSARLVAFQTREKRRYERYERIRKNEPNVLAAPDEATQMPAPAKEPAKAAEEPMPDENEPEMPAEKPEADPFGEAKEPADEVPAEKPEEGDDADVKEPADEMPAEKPEADDPFAEEGDKKDADEMPAEKEADEEPAEEMKDEDGEKPGEDAAEKDDAEKPADEKPADEKKPADDDPFGK